MMYFVLFFAGALSLVLQASALSGYLPFGADIFSILGGMAFVFGLFSRKIQQNIIYSLILIFGYFSPLILRNFIKGADQFAFFQSLASSFAVTAATTLSGSLLGFAVSFILRKLYHKWRPTLKGRTSYRP